MSFINNIPFDQIYLVFAGGSSTALAAKALTFPKTSLASTNKCNGIMETSDLRAPMRASYGRSCLRNGIMLIQNEYDRFYLGNGIMLIRTEHITGGICFHHSDHS